MFIVVLHLSPVIRWWPIASRLKSIFNCQVTAKLLEYPEVRRRIPGYIIDVQDAAIWLTKHAIFGDEGDSEGLYHLAFAMSGDATDNKGRSITPILLRLLNFPPWIRDRLAQVHVFPGSHTVFHCVYLYFHTH